MCTPNRQPPSSYCEREMASSKSRASIGSMVTMVSPVRSTDDQPRFVEALSLLAGFLQYVGRKFLAEPEFVNNGQRIDARGAAGPQHLVSTASPALMCEGNRSISMTTLSLPRRSLGARDRRPEPHRGRYRRRPPRNPVRLARNTCRRTCSTHAPAPRGSVRTLSRRRRRLVRLTSTSSPLCASAMSAGSI